MQELGVRKVVLRGYRDIDEIGQGVVCPFWTPVTLEELVVAVYKCRSYRFEEGGWHTLKNLE